MKKWLQKHKKISQVLSHIYNLVFFNRIIKKGKNNKILIKNSYLKNCRIILNGSNNRIIFNEYCNFNNSVFEIYGNDNIININNHTFGNEVNIYMEDNRNSIIIGKKCVFAGKIHFALIEGKKILIGNDCLFSSNIIFRTGDSHSILNSKTGKRINESKDILIGNHVWFTNGVTVLKGVKVSNDSVVAANSILTKKFDENNILIGGLPAKVLKYDIDWDNRRI